MTERIYYVIRRMGPKGVETRLKPGQGYGFGKLTEKTGAGAFTAEEMCKLLPTLGVDRDGKPGSQFAVPIRVKGKARYTLRCKICGADHSLTAQGLGVPKWAGFVGTAGECERFRRTRCPAHTFEVVRV